MQRLTILYIGLTLMAVAIVGTVVGVKFSIRHAEAGELTANVLVQNPVGANSVNEVVSTKLEENNTQDLVKPLNNNPDTDNNNPDTTQITYIPIVTAELVAEAGFKDSKLQTNFFDGMIFDEIDISNYRDDEHVTHHILEQNESTGYINELYFPSEEITNEVYNLVKSIIDTNENFTINETNQYGNASFFSNNQEKNNDVFLVVKLDNRLYTLHYPAKNHNKMKNLINLL